MSTPHPSQSLWDFALAFYAQPQVADACLHVQDEHGANVCLLIGLCWLDAHKQYLDEVQFNALKLHSEDWTQTVVEPLRALRRRLKLPFENFPQDEIQAELRAAIKQGELLAEKKLLFAIEHWLQHASLITKKNHHTNVENYLHQLAIPKSTIEALQKKFGEH
jgi:uncharacterized protein (TIGR02444 family)